MLAFATTMFVAGRDGTPRSEAIALLGVASVAAVVGGRAWSLLAWWRTGQEVSWIWDPLAPAGYASAGSFVAAGLVLCAARLVFGAGEFPRLIDAVTPGAFAALALTRLGCVFERCDPGRAATVFGVQYPDGAVLHPFGAYIAVPMLLAVVLIAWRVSADGRRSVGLAVTYALIRFVAEFFRESATLLHSGHLVALGVGAAAVLWWNVDARRHRA